MLIKKFKNKKDNDILYGHGYKSLKDQNTIIAYSNIYFIIAHISAVSILDFVPNAYFIAEYLYIFVIGLLEFVTLYNISEIKHISQNNLGKPLSEDAHNYYINIFILGICAFVFAICSGFILLDLIKVFFTNLMVFVFFILAMADVLEKNGDYNKKLNLCKTSSNTFIMPIKNIIEILFSKEVRNNRIDICKNNFISIYLGIKEFYCRYQ